MGQELQTLRGGGGGMGQELGGGGVQQELRDGVEGRWGRMGQELGGLAWDRHCRGREKGMGQEL